jgi:glutamate--cysteine ligase
MSIPQSGGGPIEDFAQLAEYMAAGCKPKGEWRIGTEHEKFGWLTDTGAPLPYDGPRSIRAIFDALADRHGWTPVREGDHVIGLTRGAANISLEPGGQFELSGAPFRSLHETDAELHQHLAEVHAIAAPMGVRFMGIGAAPAWSHAEMPVMPKGRYRLMTDYMGRVGTHGTQMMYRTCTVQVNLDYASEADMVQKLRVALALQPVATALFASSPFFDGQPNGHRSWRSRIWRGLDNARTGMLPWVFEDGMGFQRYVDWVLDVPMYFVYRDGRYVDALGQSFRDFLQGRLPALPGEKPTLSDWADHMTTVFPEARVKRYIEMRGADAGDAAHMTALPAFWVGLMYDQGALDAALDLVRGLDAATREGLRIAASEKALAGEAGGVRLASLAARAVALSAQGLAARGLGEERYLAPLQDSIRTGEVQADRLLAAGLDGIAARVSL